MSKSCCGVPVAAGVSVIVMCVPQLCMCGISNQASYVWLMVQSTPYVLAPTGTVSWVSRTTMVLDGVCGTDGSA